MRTGASLYSRFGGALVDQCHLLTCLLSHVGSAVDALFSSQLP